MSCSIIVEKKGCYKDDQKSPRPLPNYILTDRDSSSKVYSGIEIDWGNWLNYLPDLVCRCAQLAKSKDYKFFGIQYYGMCYNLRKFLRDVFAFSLTKLCAKLS